MTDSCVVVMPTEFTLLSSSQDDSKEAVTIWSRCDIAAGTVFRPNQGVIKHHKVSPAHGREHDDIRQNFGCQDFEERGSHFLRHCNWVTFLKRTKNIRDAKMVAMHEDGQPVFKTIHNIRERCEIETYFYLASDTFGEGDTRTKLRNKSPNEGDIISERGTERMDCTAAASDTSFNGQEVTTMLNHSVDKLISPCSSTGDDSGMYSCDSPVSASNVPDSTTSSQQIASFPNKRNRQRTWLPCEVCGKKFDRPSLLRRHMRTHTGEKPHACDICGKAFSTSSSLNTHRRIHSGEKPHQCKTCGKCFTASSNLYYHRMTHSKEKPHKCEMCSKSFPTPGDLKSHMYVHNGSWPFKCDICNRGFSKQTNLKNHLMLHTGDKPHICFMCSKRFALHCNLKTHLKTHEDEPQEKCVGCHQPFLVALNRLFRGFCKTCLTKPGTNCVGTSELRPKSKARSGVKSFSIDNILKPDEPENKSDPVVPIVQPMKSTLPLPSRLPFNMSFLAAPHNTISGVMLANPWPLVTPPFIPHAAGLFPYTRAFQAPTLPLTRVADPGFHWRSPLMNNI